MHTHTYTLPDNNYIIGKEEQQILFMDISQCQWSKSQIKKKENFNAYENKIYTSTESPKLIIKYRYQLRVRMEKGTPSTWTLEMS